MRVCVLQPDYTGSEVAYRNFDPPRDLSSLLPDCEVDHLFLRKATTYKQLREASARRYDIFVNLCEAYLEWDIPSLDVIWSLDLLKLPYTGPGTRLYDPSKPLMKYVAYTGGIPSPRFVEASGECGCDRALEHLQFPMFVKPAHSGDSLGIDADSRVTSEPALRAKTAQIVAGFGKAMIEEYIDGREFTVLAAADPRDPFHPLALRPLEFVFPAGGPRFKTYPLKVEQHHPECNVPVDDPELDTRLRTPAQAIFTGFEGEGYARLDFRMNQAGEIFFLEINFACSVFYQEGYEGSADYILKSDPLGPSGFLRHIIAEGIERHRRRRTPYERRGDAVSGFGIYATEPIPKGQIVRRGEECPHRLVSRDHVNSTWPRSRVDVLGRPGVPVSRQVFALWSENPGVWAPQNHSCDPNTAYLGLNVVALRDIAGDEELTLDYADLCDGDMTPFQCNCGSHNCRGEVIGRRKL